VRYPDSQFEVKSNGAGANRDIRGHTKITSSDESFLDLSNRNAQIGKIKPASIRSQPTEINGAREDPVGKTALFATAFDGNDR
jgi:hypothetical protein